MKYKTFRAIVGAGALLLGGGLLALGVVQCGSCADERAKAEATAGKEPAGAPASRGQGASPPQGAPQQGAPQQGSPQQGAAAPAGPGGTQGPAEEGPLRDLDRKLLARVAQNISSDKEKDAIRGEAWKVNLYKDAGKSKVNRAKVDLDRDDKFDEKWTFEDDGRVKRQVAPADDERYTVELRLEGERWRLKR